MLDPTTTWELEVTIGLLDTGTAGRVNVHVVVGGDRPNALDDPWAVLVSTTLAAGDTRVLKVPLGLWPLRNNFVLALQTSKTSTNTQPDLVVLEDAALVPGPARPEMGIARSNINWSPDPANVINGIAGLNPGWLRNTTGYNIGSYHPGFGSFHADKENSNKWKTWSGVAHTNYQGGYARNYYQMIQDALNLIGTPAISAAQFRNTYGNPPITAMAQKARSYIQKNGNEALNKCISI
jgi:hypothetical protein